MESIANFCARLSIQEIQFKMTNKSWIAKYNPLFPLTPGLFQSVTAERQKTHNFKAKYELKDGLIVHISGEEILSPHDLRILHALVALAGTPNTDKFGSKSNSKWVISDNPKDDIAKSLRGCIGADSKSCADWDAVLGMQSCDYNASNFIARIQTSYYQIACEAGLHPTGSLNRARIQNSIERLYRTSIIFEKSGVKTVSQCHSRLISFFFCKNDDNPNAKSVHIALNPLLSHQALRGGKSGIKFTSIDMEEVRALKGNNELMLHFRLCGWLDYGKQGTVGLDTLCSYIWPTSATQAHKRLRRLRARKALEQLQAIGWKVEETAKNKFDITRPALKEVNEDANANLD